MSHRAALPALGLMVLVPMGFAMTRPTPRPRPTPVKVQRPAPATPKLPDGTTTSRDLAYGPHARNTLDLYVPTADKPLPLVVWVHGGAWLGGSKNGANPALKLLDKGYAVAAVNYRLSQHAKFPAQIEDCKAAVRFLRANAKKYNLNPDAFGAWGSSAGGHLVALLGTTGDVADFDGTGDVKDGSSRVQAVCDFFGPTDLTRMQEQAGGKGKIDHDAADAPEAKLIGGPVQENKEKAAKANPITYISKGDPPVLIFHGDQDFTVPVGQSEIFHAALKKAGVDTTLVVVPGGGHGNGIGTPGHVATITKFFDAHLK